MTATSKADALRFLTFTIASSTAPLREQMDRLTACYKALRRTPEYAAHVRGAIATIEVTRNPTTGQWHPHLHVLADGVFWRQGNIADVWERVTGDSRVVDVRAVRGRARAADYVAKYASKPPELKSWPPEAICDYAAAVARRRMLITTGSMHGVKGDLDGDSEDDVVVGVRVPLHAIERRSVLGCKRAAVVLASLASQSAAYQSSLALRPPGTSPNLAPGTQGQLLNPKRAFAELAEHWAADPVSFVMGGDGNWYGRQPPPKPPGRGRYRDQTPNLDGLQPRAW